MINVDYIYSNLPYLVAMSLLAILLFVSILRGVFQANRLRETLLEMLEISKNQELPVQLQKTIFHQLYLPEKYIGILKRDDYLKMLEKLKRRELLLRWQISPKHLILQSYYVARRAFAKLYLTLRHKSTTSKQNHY